MESAVENTAEIPSDGRRGRPFVYSDHIVKFVLELRILFKLSYRSVEGLSGSLLALAGINLPVPTYTQLARRSKAAQYATSTS
jgi:hypothetical protein